MKRITFLKKLPPLFLAGFLLAAPLGVFAQPAPESSTTPSPATSSGSALVITMSDLGNPDGHTLKTVKTERGYFFNRPKHWKISPQSIVNLTLQHSPSLLPERSNLNVLVNNRILKTIPLTKDNIRPTSVSVSIPPEILKDKNSLVFQVDQHYTYDCEDPFSPELWTTIMPESTVRLVYSNQALRPDLSQFPYPFFDELGYGATRISFIAPNSLSNPSLEALGMISTRMGQHIGWRPYLPSLDSGGSLSQAQHVILVGTPQENPVISQLQGSMPLRLQSDRFIDPKSGQALSDQEGVLAVFAHPRYPYKAVLVVSGNSPEGVRQAARLLTQKPTHKILAGSYAIAREVPTGPQEIFRRWEGFLSRPQGNLWDMGLETLTTRSITALPIFYRMNLLPDLHLPGKTKTRLKTVYSYSSQLDERQSNLEVLLNGKSLGSVPLNKREGQNLAEFNVDIPSEEVFTFNELQYRFHLFPDKYDACRFVTDVHLWGTIHNTTAIDLPAKIRTALPDVGLLNDGGFPFTMYQDLSEVTVVVPNELNSTHMDLLLQLTARLGRGSNSHRGIQLVVSREKDLPGGNKSNHHLIVLGTLSQTPLIEQFKSKASWYLKGESAWVQLPEPQQRKLAELHPYADQGVMEEMLSPWNGKRIALLLTGQGDEALRQIARFLADDKRFNAMEAGNLVVVNPDNTQSATVLDEGAARFVYPFEFTDFADIPIWLWVLVGFFTLLGLLSFVRFLFFSR